MEFLWSPSSEHMALREMVRHFAESEIAPQALEHDRAERFNLDLFRRLGELGLLGVTRQSGRGVRNRRGRASLRRRA